MTSLSHEPSGRWSFDKSVADCFDDMLRRSIPQYEVMRSACVDIARSFVRSGAVIYDLGCSRAEALVGFFEAFGARCEYVGIETSRPMVDAARSRTKDLRPFVRIVEGDIRESRLDNACVALSVLTLQFVPVNYRQQILASVYESLNDGGAMIVVEKVLGLGARVDNAQVDSYHRMKSAHGYSDDSINRKRLALEGVLVPLTYRENSNMLYRAGFREVDSFWRWMNFCGFIALK